MATKKSTPKPSAVNRTLNNLHLLSAVVFAGLAVLTSTLVKATTYPLTKSYLTENKLTNSLAPAQKLVYDFDIRWALLLMLVVLALYSVLHVSRWQDSYQKALNGRIYFWRWVGAGLTGAVMMETVGMLSGIQDIVTLKSIGALTVLAAGLGWLAERQNEKATKPVWSAFLLSVFAAGMAWLAIGMYVCATWVHGMAHPPTYVQIIYAIVLAQYALVGINMINQFRKYKNWKTYAIVERNYVLITLFGKSAFALALILGLRG